MANYNVALILKNPLNDSEFLLLKQTPPPKFNEEEYDSYVDSDLWDLPAIKLNHIQGEKSEPTISIQGSEKINVSKFDIESALNQVIYYLHYQLKRRIWICFLYICYCHLSLSGLLLIINSRCYLFIYFF